MKLQKKIAKMFETIDFSKNVFENLEEQLNPSKMSKIHIFQSERNLFHQIRFNNHIFC